MVKRISSRKATHKRISKQSIPKKHVHYYLKLYGVSFSIGLFVLLTGFFLFPPKSPCANSATCQSDLSLHVDNSIAGLFEGHPVLPPTIDLSQGSAHPAVLGADTISGTKHIYIDLSSQILYAYQGTKQVMKTLIASGKWNPTPVGNFHIWEKLRSTRMAGGEGADAYDLPNVPFVMYFYNDFGLHGAYWHNNFGHPMSHGCVNMRIVDAEALYTWADGPNGDQLGTAVSVCNHFTTSGTCVQDNPIN